MGWYHGEGFIRLAGLRHEAIGCIAEGPTIMSWRRGRGDWDWGWSFPKSQPREVKGGIKAQSRRGEFGSTWWAKRWIDVLHGFHIGARLDRGRSYARKGQGLNVEVAKGVVRARGQGSPPT